MRKMKRMGKLGRRWPIATPEALSIDGSIEPFVAFIRPLEVYMYILPQCGRLYP